MPALETQRLGFSPPEKEMAMVSYPAAEVLVDTLWILRHLEDPGIRIVECDVDPGLFDSGHIPGAVKLDGQADLAEFATRDMVDRNEFEDLAGRLGIANDTEVVFYGDEHNLLACHAYWVFRVFGHTRMRILNGGRARWIADCQRLVRDQTVVTPTRYFSQDRSGEFRARREDVLRQIGGPDLHALRLRLIGRAIVDDRSPAEFQGQFQAGAGYPARFSRAGHIPGATNLPWRELMRVDGTFRSADEIIRALARRGLTPEKDIIVYTRIGERSAVTWFVLHELMGFPRVRNYDGGWTEWGNIVGLPIEEGALVPVGPPAGRQRSAEPIRATA